MNGLKIVGMGRGIPAKRVTNDDLSRLLKRMMNGSEKEPASVPDIFAVKVRAIQQWHARLL